MVHTFDCLGKSFLLDVESGSIFNIDKLTKLIINNRISPNVKIEGEILRYSKSEIDEANSEIDELINEGVLFSPEIEHKEAKYSGIVKAMCLNVSHLCNLRCEYCFADGGSYNSKSENMSDEVAQRAIDLLIRKSGSRRNLEVDFFGGEPLLNFEVVKNTIEYARSKETEFNKKFRFTITTNAMLLNDDIIEYLNKEIYNVVVSIDGRQSVHDCVRKTVSGQGSFEKAIQNALNFKDKRIGQYYIRGTYTSKNKDFGNDVLYLNSLGFNQLSIEPVVLPDKHNLAISESDIPELEREYERLAQVYVERRKNDATWFNFFHFMLDIYNGPCETKRLMCCGAGNDYLAVAPNGNIFPCHQFDGEEEYIIGNVLENTFSEELPTYFAENNLLKKDDCKKCWAKYYCSGGCAANAIKYGGHINKPCKLSCSLMRKRIECAIAVNCAENV